jgi:hypothetical protein
MQMTTMHQEIPICYSTSINSWLINPLFIDMAKAEEIIELFSEYGARPNEKSS